jgi:hypothetical protein
MSFVEASLNSKSRRPPITDVSVYILGSIMDYLFPKILSVNVS